NYGVPAIGSPASAPPRTHSYVPRPAYPLVPAPTAPHGPTGANHHLATPSLTARWSDRHSQFRPPTVGGKPPATRSTGGLRSLWSGLAPTRSAGCRRRAGRDGGPGASEADNAVSVRTRRFAAHAPTLRHRRTTAP